MKLIKDNIWLILICVLFLFTRFYKISTIPESVYWDEASIGYNAYSVSTDLKDEWGEFLPLHFRAFGEFKLPVYIYSVAVLVKLFGLNAFSVRAPAVLYSLGVVILSYLISIKFFERKEIGLLSAFFVTTMPWFFVFSRTGYEATAGLFFFLVGIYLFLLDRKWTVFLSVVSFIGAIYSYNAFRILVPLTLGLMVLQRYISVRRNWKQLSVGGLLLGLSLIPIIRLYVLDYGGARLATVGVGDAGEFVVNYFKHFSLDFLFVNGDLNVRSQIPGEGQLLLISLPLIVLGLVKILKQRKKEYWFVLAMLLLSPLPAAITREAPHALRAILAVFPWAVIVTLGVGRNKYMVSGIALISLILFGNYFGGFVRDYNHLSASAWQLEYKQIVESGETVISDEYGQPYIFTLYYHKYDPKVFRESARYNDVSDWGFSTVASFGKYEFYKK